jgi:CheY-like chemotaxis protein
MPDASGSSRPLTDWSTWTVLVADESSATRMTLGAAVRAFDPDIRIVEAQTGRQALDLITKGAPDLAFVNIQLPEMSGAEALAWSVAQGARVPTVLMSAQVLPKWVEVSTELGAYEFLKKPFDPDHIVHLMRGFARMRAPARLLLVDESAASRQLVRRVITASQFTLEIDETDGGQHALKLLRLAPYDLAIIDSALTGSIDGLETACQAREAAPSTKIVMMSASASPTLAQAARHFGVTSVLRKPFYAHQVDHALHAAFGLRRPYLLNARVAQPPARARRAGGA